MYKKKLYFQKKKKRLSNISIFESEGTNNEELLSFELETLKLQPFNLNIILKIIMQNSQQKKKIKTFE